MTGILYVLGNFTLFLHLFLSYLIYLDMLGVLEISRYPVHPILLDIVFGTEPSFRSFFLLSSSTQQWGWKELELKKEEEKEIFQHLVDGWKIHRTFIFNDLTLILVGLFFLFIYYFLFHSLWHVVDAQQIFEWPFFPRWVESIFPNTEGLFYGLKEAKESEN